MSTNMDRELTETELDCVVGGDVVLSHEAVHDTHTPKKPLLAPIAILMG